MFLYKNTLINTIIQKITIILCRYNTKPKIAKYVEIKSLKIYLWRKKFSFVLLNSPNLTYKIV